VTRQRRERGTGSIHRRSGGLWVAAVDVNAHGSPRRKKRAASSLFCVTLRRLAELREQYPRQGPPTQSLGSRKANLERARTLGTHTRSEWNRKVWLSKGVCEYCGEVGYAKLPSTGEWCTRVAQDHKIPLCRSGSDSIDNLAVSCERCNNRKGRMTADEYMAVLRNG